MHIVKNTGCNSLLTSALSAALLLDVSSMSACIKKDTKWLWYRQDGTPANGTLVP